MKKEKIYSLFRKEYNLHLHNKMYVDGGKKKLGLQYVSNGIACYPLENMPEFDSTTLPSLLGVPKDEPRGYSVTEAPDWLYTAIEDFHDSDIPLKSHCYDAFGYMVFQTYHNNMSDSFENVTIFVDPKYLTPILDEDCEYVLREVSENLRAVIVKAGLLTKAIIMPMTFISDSQLDTKIEFIQDLYTELNFMRNNKKADEEQLTLL